MTNGRLVMADQEGLPMLRLAEITAVVLGNAANTGHAAAGPATQLYGWLVGQ